MTRPTPNVIGGAENILIVIEPKLTERTQNYRAKLPSASRVTYRLTEITEPTERYRGNRNIADYSKPEVTLSEPEITPPGEVSGGSRFFFLTYEATVIVEGTEKCQAGGALSPTVVTNQKDTQPTEA